jgi:hypothetical protein
MSEGPKKRVIDRIALLLFVYSITALVFAYGVIVGRYRTFPYAWLADAGRGVQERLVAPSGPSVLPFGASPHDMSEAYYDYTGARIHDRDAMAPGVTLLTGSWSTLDWKYGVRLIDPEGNVLHEWATDPAAIWSDSPDANLVAGGRSKSKNYIHGCYLFDNGDILFNTEYMGLVRMNARGDVLWKLACRSHHSVTRDDDGNFWVCSLKWLEDTPQGHERASRYSGIDVPATEDFALKVSEDGVILREVSILKALYGSEEGRRLLWKTNYERSGDVTHVNDVEPLLASMADQYPLFSANDILVSSRILSAVFVIDSETEEIKWLHSDFLLQHDPDFVGNGDILVFDNNYDGSDDGMFLGGSRIVRLNPGNADTDVCYPRKPSQRFYTQFGGKVQSLANGNLLITEATRGRVFEVSETGEIIWEWVAERFRDNYVREVHEGTRYPFSREHVAAWSVKNNE